MAEEKRTAFQNIKGLKGLCDESNLPRLRSQVVEIKKNADNILRELRSREKELTKIRQEQKQAQKMEDAGVIGEVIGGDGGVATESAKVVANEKPTHVEISVSATQPINAEQPKVVDNAIKDNKLQDTVKAEKAVKAEKVDKEVPRVQVEAVQNPIATETAVPPVTTSHPVKTDKTESIDKQAAINAELAQKKIIYEANKERMARNDRAQNAPRQPYDRSRDGQNGTRPPYNRDGGNKVQFVPNQNSARPPYNRDGQTGTRPPYNRDGQNGTRPPYNRDGQGARPPYNRDGQGARPPYSRDGQTGSRPPFNSRPQNTTFVAPAIATKDLKSTSTAKKKVSTKQGADEKKVMNKKALIQKGFVDVYRDDENRMGSRKIKTKKQKELISPAMMKIEHAVVNSQIVPIKVLSERIGVTAVEITKKLFKEGIIKTINDSLDFDTAAFVAADIGVELELKLDKTAEETMLENFVPEVDSDENLVARPPIVTVMGHVDHGKTSLLDAIRKTSVTSGEAGGITQHIGAYTVKAKKRDITFIDTPGHEAFTAMRKRGADVTDVAILVVAADDGVMPQTKEAVSHAKAANVQIIVAINKIDKPGANLDRIRQQLADLELVCEEWGGQTIMVPVSAHTKEGIDTLLEMILLTTDVRELKANPNRKAKGTIIEAKLDKGKGPVASIIIQNGTLHVGDVVIAGMATGKIRAMIDDKGRNVKEAGPSFAVSVLGFSDVPEAGDELHVVADEKAARVVADERKNRSKEQNVVAMGKVTLDDMFDKITEGQIKNLNIIVKADVQGSVEAVKQALMALVGEEVKVNVIHAGVGAVTETDVMLAATSNAIVVAFNVRPDANAKTVVERDNVDVRLYRVIYDAIEDIKLAMKGMVAPKYQEVIIGSCEVRNTFKATSIGTIAGCYILDGKFVRGAMVRVFREGEKVFEGKLSSLKRFKDDVKEVAAGYECGVTIDGFNDIKELDRIEAYINEIVK